eukprot:scaffold686_cov177-Ochromonas_danica.AAC.11
MSAEQLRAKDCEQRRVKYCINMTGRQATRTVHQLELITNADIVALTCRRSLDIMRLSLIGVAGEKTETGDDDWLDSAAGLSALDSSFFNHFLLSLFFSSPFLLLDNKIRLSQTTSTTTTRTNPSQVLAG